LKNLEERVREIRRVLSRISSLYVGVVVHKNADPDAIASAIAIAAYLSDLKNYSYIVLPEGLNRVAKRVVQAISDTPRLYSISELRVLHGITDIYIVLDTSNPVQLGEAARYIANSDYVLIDHHELGELATRARYKLIAKTTSTSELVYLILKDCWHISREVATLLLAGMLYDNRRFAYVDPLVFSIVDELINTWHADYHLALRALTRDMDFSERVARLKGSKRIKLLKCGDIIVAVTHVSAYEASVANALIELGADAAFVVSEKGDGVRVVARANKAFIDKTRLNLGGYFMKVLAEKLGGSGGGHVTAGVAVCPGKSFEEVYKMLIKLLNEYLKLESLE